MFVHELKAPVHRPKLLIHEIKHRIDINLYVNAVIRNSFVRKIARK